jgi:gliding motility-associated-like protein
LIFFLKKMLLAKWLLGIYHFYFLNKTFKIKKLRIFFEQTKMPNGIFNTSILALAVMQPTLLKSALRGLILVSFLVSQHTAWGQLDSIHWLPPIHARSEFGPQYVYLSTPEVDPFVVTIRRGNGQFLANISISNSQPAVYSLGNTNNTAVLVPEDSLLVVLRSRGLILEAPKQFYANFRSKSNSEYQAGDLTCKGRPALGLEFRIGHLFQSTTQSNNGSRSNFVGVLATEDSTVVTLSQFTPGTDIRRGDGTELTNTGPVSMTLNAGESVVFAHYVTGNASAQPPNGLLGSLLSATRPVAVNCGSWTGAPEDYNNDIGIDQIAPFEEMGREYILCKGNGANILETPIVIAHVNGTQVFVNGNATPVATLNAGQYVKLQTAQYSAVGNMYIETTEPVFVYQIIGGVPTGDDIARTGGLCFVPPISCAIPSAVDNIFQPNQIGNLAYDGGLMIVAMRDSTVTLRVDGVVVPLGTPETIPGNPDFVTYRRLTLFSANNPPTVASVVANGAIQVALFGRNGAAGFGAFYSGFSKNNKPNLSLIKLQSDGVCPDTLLATGRFDGIQWYYRDSLLTFGPDSTFIAYAPGEYIARAYLGVCRRTDFVQDTISLDFVSPEFPYTVEQPSCFGFSDGRIAFGEPAGGLPPYEYSIDQGFSFSQNPNFGVVRAGDYALIARDVTGCYNRPLDISIGQPDSIVVEARIVRIDEPVKPGEGVTVEAFPSRAVVSASWVPNDGGPCDDDCLRYEVFPQETTWYTVTVLDSMGCPATDRVQVVVEPNVYAPNVFNPQSGQGNDRFTLFSRAPLPIKSLRVYDRWGELVFERQNTQTNDLSMGWDGTHQGQALAPAVFVFVAEVEYLEGYRIFLKGDVTLLR